MTEDPRIEAAAKALAERRRQLGIDAELAQAAIEAADRVASYATRLHHRLRDRLPMWTIYKPTTPEYPGLWVARMYISLPEPRPTRFVLTSDTLVGVRAQLPLGLTLLAASPQDDPVIEETWL